LATDREVQLLQSGLKLADETILSECTSTKIEYKGAVILMYHFTSEYSKEYSIRYLNRPVKGSATICRVQLFSNDTVADLKAAIEEATGIPQQNQALYDGDSLYRIELRDPLTYCVTFTISLITLCGLYYKFHKLTGNIRTDLRVNIPKVVGITVITFVMTAWFIVSALPSKSLSDIHSLSTWLENVTVILAVTIGILVAVAGFMHFTIF